MRSAWIKIALMKTARLVTTCTAAAVMVLCALAAAAEADARAVHGRTLIASLPSVVRGPSTVQATHTNQPAGVGGTQSPAAQPPSQATTQPGTANGPQTKTQATATIVRDVYVFGHEDPADTDRSSAAIDDIIIVKVDGLASLVNQSRCVDDDNRTLANCIERPLALFIDGREMTGIAPEAVDVNAGTLHFHLHRSGGNNEAWADLLGAPPLGSGFFLRPSKISVGLQEGSPVSTAVRSFLLVRIDKGWFVAGFIAIGVLVFSLIRLARRSDLLRAAGPPPVAENGQPLPKAYSLARFQMAFWFLVVVSAYCLIWLITGASDTISGSVLALIGIGSGTALGAAVVDVSKNQPAPPSKGFLKDILSDANGVCFHRFQMFVWTLVLGVMFVSSVYYDLSMPEFSATLLGLQGISAGTYLGFKIPEKQG
ncbi:MAG TPA: hypothetical protein VJH03_18360 [Blastocatellia bacterium]|nr:hypothetical protein [Blastocatellia bacterium]